MKKLNKKNIKPVFRNLDYPIQGAVSFADLLRKFINEFSLTPIIYVSVLAQMKCVSGKHATIGNRRPLNVRDPKDVMTYVKYLETIFNTQMQKYKTEVPISIFFNYSVEGEGTFQTMKRIVSANKTDLLKENNLDRLDNLPLDRGVFTRQTSSKTLRVLFKFL
uniref:hypothetical protein n=1 Tax=Porodaedalea niemelaei TaxID=175858 RepID=UPI0023AA7823|nr:hypothetical protein P1R16_mgp04 [Porodaedalea niemelaei]WCF76635.1 hypothetical protein [Porodaedalea niemelaei]